MSSRAFCWVALFVGVSFAAVGAVLLEVNADEHVPFYSERQSDLAPDPDVYMEGLRPDQEAPIGTPEMLPYTTNLLSPAEIDTARAIALGDKNVSDRLAGHRYQVVEAEKCGEKEGNCSRLGIFDYDAGVCLHVLVSAGSVTQVVEAGCSPSNREMVDARAIAESDLRVQEVLEAYDNETFIAARAWFPRPAGAQEGHRYVAVRWNLDGGKATAEFVVDLTTRTVCHEC